MTGKGSPQALFDRFYPCDAVRVFFPIFMFDKPPKPDDCDQPVVLIEDSKAPKKMKGEVLDDFFPVLSGWKPPGSPPKSNFATFFMKSHHFLSNGFSSS